jgi:hypothetical protein
MTTDIPSALNILLGIELGVAVLMIVTLTFKIKPLFDVFLAMFINVSILLIVFLIAQALLRDHP